MSIDQPNAEHAAWTQAALRLFQQAGQAPVDVDTVLHPPHVQQSWALSSQTQLVVTTDTLVQGVHFLTQTTAFDLGYKALAVNLSDLAAMGAKARAVGLTLVLQHYADAWLEGFVAGWQILAQSHSLTLAYLQVVEGETLSVHVQAYGEIEPGQAVCRHQAQVGDWVCVSGYLGEAAMGLRLAQSMAAELSSPHGQHLFARLNRPTPRLALGRCLVNHAHACIDISDGLIADLGHICQQSQLGAELHWDRFAISPALQALCSPGQLLSTVLTGGDDYELCFTATPEQFEAIQSCSDKFEQIHAIGEIVQTPGVRVYDGDQQIPLNHRGYEHFKTD